MGLTDYLAIYGAGLSTAVAVWNALRSRSRIRVLVTFALNDQDGETQSGIGISVQNPSAHTVHISNVSFLYPYRVPTLREGLKHLIRFKRLPRNQGWCHSLLSNFQPEDGCPTSIESDKSHWIFVPEEALEKLFEDAISRNLKIVVQDDLWRNKYSKTFYYETPSNK